MRRSGRDREFDSFVAARLPSLLRSSYLLCGDADRASVLVEDALAAALRQRVAPGVAEDYVQRHVVKALVRRRGGWLGARRGDAAAVGAGAGVAPAAVNGAAAGAGTTDAPRAQPDPDRAGAAGADPHELVWAGLGELPARDRAVLVLRHAEGRSDVDIAERTGLRPAAVRESLAAGLAALPQLPDRPEPAVLVPGGTRDPGGFAPPAQQAAAATLYAAPVEGYQRPRGEDAFRRPADAGAARPAPDPAAYRRPAAPLIAGPPPAPAPVPAKQAPPPAETQQAPPYDPAQEARPPQSRGLADPPDQHPAAGTPRRGEELWGRPR